MSAKMASLSAGSVSRGVRRLARGLDVAIFAILSLALTLAGIGCNNAPRGHGDDAKSGEEREKLTARQTLDRMAEAYRKAQTYEDVGELRFRAKQNGRWEDTPSAPFTVAFERPNKLRLHLFNAELVSDGEKIWADMAAIEGQVLSVPAPEKLSANTINIDPVLTQELTRFIGGPLQLLLLLEPDATATLLNGAKPPTLLEDQSLTEESSGEHECRRVEIQRPDGRFILWIDADTFLLRRVELPSSLAAREIGSAGADEFEMAAEFSRARLDAKIPPEAFSYKVSPEAKLVRRFIRGDAPPPPSETLGKPMPDFELARLGGGEGVTLESLRGKFVVLEAWGLAYPQCQAHLLELQKVFASRQDHDKLVFYTVNIDEAAISDEQLDLAFAQANMTIPQLRDRNLSFARDTIKIQGLPGLYLIDDKGVLQDEEIGLNPALASVLPAKLDKLVAGESLHEECRRRYAERLEEHKRMLQELSISDADVVEVPRAEIAPASQPGKYALKPVFVSRAAKAPGNLLTVGGFANDSRIFALDGSRKVVEIGADGNAVNTIELDIPPEAALGFLRSGADASGKRYFLVSGHGERQVHLFDEDWKRLWSHPEGTNPGVHDAQIADFAGKGELEIVIAYGGPAGVHGVTIDGTRIWNNRRIENVFRLVATEPEADGTRLLLAADGQGTIDVIAHGGANFARMPLRGRFVRWLASAELAPPALSFCALSAVRPGEDSVVGFDREGQVTWNYDLPLGVYPNPALEPITGGPLLEGAKGVWVFAGADGSLHLVDAKGESIDRFNVGQSIRGLAVANIGGEATLLVSAGMELLAWRLEPKPQE